MTVEVWSETLGDASAVVTAGWNEIVASVALAAALSVELLDSTSEEGIELELDTAVTVARGSTDAAVTVARPSLKLELVLEAVDVEEEDSVSVGEEMAMTTVLEELVEGRVLDILLAEVAALLELELAADPDDTAAPESLGALVETANPTAGSPFSEYEKTE